MSRFSSPTQAPQSSQLTSGCRRLPSFPALQHRVAGAPGVSTRRGAGGGRGAGALEPPGRPKSGSMDRSTPPSLGPTLPRSRKVTGWQYAVRHKRCPNQRYLFFFGGGGAPEKLFGGLGAPQHSQNAGAQAENIAWQENVSRDGTGRAVCVRGTVGWVHFGRNVSGGFRVGIRILGVGWRQIRQRGHG